jgi:NTE family protein
MESADIPTRSHASFALVLSGGGARGLAHVGVLQALAHHGYTPQAIVGVSMGAIVGATYALNPAWYQALLSLDTHGFPEPMTTTSASWRERLRQLRAYRTALWTMLTGWGPGERARPYGQQLLEQLTLGRRLEEARVPVVAVATDLVSGERVILSRGKAATNLYASAALAGILPPLNQGDSLLADGAYADIAPVDVARSFGVARVIAVALRPPHNAKLPRNGVQAMVRALEICHHQHAQARFAQADLCLEPRFPYAIDMLDFRHARTCVAAGFWAVRAALPGLRRLLESEHVSG